MFHHVGRKLKILAKLFCWIGIAASIVLGLGTAFGWLGNNEMLGLMVGVGGCLFSWIGSLGLYGFGVLVENSDIRTELAVKAAKERNP